MKSFNHLFEIASSDEIRALAIHKASLGKRRKFSRFLKDERLLPKTKQWVENFYPGRHHPVIIYDGIRRKQRTIIVPTFAELVVQHCVVEAVKPVMFQGMYRHSYASIPERITADGVREKRGAHKGKKYIQRWLKDVPNTQYVLKMDIKHFFETVDHDILKAMFARKIHDDRMLDLINKIIDITDIGLPIGFYTSQWFSNFYLQGLDHYIKEQLHAKYYIRYMDDMIVFGGDKDHLHEIRRKVEQYLITQLKLEMKDNWQVFPLESRPLDFMGFKFFRNRVTLRRSIMLKCSRKAKKIYRKAKMTIYDIRQVMSYMGWIGCTDTYGFYLEHVKPFVDFRYCMKRISQYDRRLNYGTAIL